MESRFNRKSRKIIYRTAPNHYSDNKNDRVSSVYFEALLWDKLNKLAEETEISRNALIYMAVCDFLVNDKRYMKSLAKDENALKFLKQHYKEYVE